MEQTLQKLNNAQQEAARHIDGPMLILAGAGSGKTRTLTTRLAYLLSLGIDPASTLTLTFTNKAALEMRERALSLIGTNTIYPPLMCTFHKFGLLFLKFHIRQLGRPNNFLVADEDDKKKIIKRMDDRLPAGVYSREISLLKNASLSWQEALDMAEDKNEICVAETYKKYQQYLEGANLVDFDDLLLLPYRILSDFPDVRKESSERYGYIMVDEYQDTNILQFGLLKMLCSTHENLVVVGDDDQSIYGWRGADVGNILNFTKNFQDAKMVKLEQNYRSSSQILRLANDVIRHNLKRIGKELVSVRAEGEAVRFATHEDETAEANSVASQIQKLLKNGVSAKEIAVLFRINALSRSVEEGLRRHSIAFRFVGGTKFYERAEVKDALSYLRLAANVHDDFSFRRVVNVPKRGIGKTTIDKLDALGTEHSVSLLHLCSNESLLSQASLSKKTHAALLDFAKDIASLASLAAVSPKNMLDELEATVGLRRYFESLPHEDERVQNIDEFYGMLNEQFRKNPSQTLEDFLNEISLQSDDEKAVGEEVQIMTVHASKGLEFEHVFVVGLEDGFFPIANDGVNIEEERRLAYVAFTRAKDGLYLNCARSRFLRGKRERLPKSRFLKEAGLTDDPIAVGSGGSAQYAKNDLVKHKLFGFGRVMEVQRSGDVTRLVVNFGGSQRTLLSDFVQKAI